MNLYNNEIFHIYNRGNNRQKLFFCNENYSFFLRKVKTHIAPHCDILAWCLMPNHFHFMIYISADKDHKKVSKGFQTAMSSYTRAINLQENRIGSLFTQNTRSKALTDRTGINHHPTNCFNYIHLNPVASGFVKDPKDWPYSSYCDYFMSRGGVLVNREMAQNFVELNLSHTISDIKTEGIL